jgi:hypothetical protein
MKRGALHASTGKSEIWTSICAAASNDFLVDDMKRRTDEHAHQENTGDEDRRAAHHHRQYSQEATRLMPHIRERRASVFRSADLQEEQELANLAFLLGHDEFTKKKAIIKHSATQVKKLLDICDKTRAPNKLQKQRGEEIPTRLLSWLLGKELLGVGP